VVSKDTVKLAEILEGFPPIEQPSSDTVQTHQEPKLPSKAGNLKLPPVAQELALPSVVTSNDTATADDLKPAAKNLKDPPISADQKIPPAVSSSGMAEATDQNQPAKAGKLKKSSPARLKDPPPRQNPLLELKSSGKLPLIVGGKHLPVLLTSSTKKRKKKAPVLPTRASAQLKSTGDDTELEDLTQLAVPETFSEFAGVHNPSVDDYFGAMQNESRRRQEFSAASRRNRMKLRGERKSPEELALIKSALIKQKQFTKEANKRQRDMLEGYKKVKAQLKEELAQAGRDLIPLLTLMTGDDKRKAKKAKGELDKLFPSTKTTENAERRYVLKLKKEMPAAEWQFVSKEVKEAGELQKVRYKFRQYDIPEHFIGMKRSPSDPSGELVPFINPDWIEYHFHEKFVSAVKAFGNVSNKWVEVPIGSARNAEDMPPMADIVKNIPCHYKQGNKDYCMFYSFASAMYYLGFQKESESLRLVASQLEYRDRTSQLVGIRSAITELKVFEECPVVWGQRKKRHLQFDVLKNISNDPTLIIPWGGDGGVQHAVTIVGHYIFDSSTHHALRLTRDSLDWCCNTALGFRGVHLAIRFPIRQVHKRARVRED
jgi:hypothetical protein